MPPWIYFFDVNAWYMPLTDIFILDEDMPWELRDPEPTYSPRPSYLLP